MNKTYLIIMALLFSLSVGAQSFSEKVALRTCELLDTIQDLNQLQDSLKNYTTRAFTEVMQESALEEKQAMSTVEGITGAFKEVDEILPSYCYHVRELIIAQKKLQYYGLSQNEKANDYYREGNSYLDNKVYTNAAKAFKKAIAEDDEFVYAYDHLAIAHRRQNDFKKAVKYYKKSLAIFPEGDVALLNIAVAYSFLKDYKTALNYYQKLIFLYQDNPEGYFGAGKMQFILSDYKTALKNVFRAHLIYVNTQSAYIADSEQLLGMMYSTLKKEGKLNLFQEVAQLYNVNVNVQ